MSSIELRVFIGSSHTLIPHSFVVVTGPDGVEHGYGLAPKETGTLTGPGNIFDDLNHPYTSTTGKIDLTDADYRSVMDYIQRSKNNPPDYYLPFGSQCANWAVGALREAGIPGIYPNMIPDNILRDMFETIVWNPYTQWMNIEISNLLRSARTPTRRDPLAIDLDGDGIETVGIPTTGSPILFDHDADGVKTGTGWVKPDDAWLVLDRNGNGTIDSGRELFGVDTLITVTEVTFGADGPRTYNRNARTGFEALATYDTGNGTAGSAGYRDGVFDARDADFAKVQLWQDLNQDGVSQSNELFSLASKNITAISVTPTTGTANLGNGNTLTGQATVTRSSGPAGVIGSVDLQASNLNLADNPFYRQFPNSVPLTAQARALPEMGGSGWLRDLREAMSLGTASATQLSQLVTTFAAGATRDQQVAALGPLLAAWAGTTGRVDGNPFRPMASTVLTDDGTRRTLRITPMDPVNYPNPATQVVEVAEFALPPEYYETFNTSDGRQIQRLNGKRLVTPS